ncbi:MAG: glycosyltransferase family 39 protein [Flavobacteriales bacterium]|nr:glycosyltransferase family 39 protein [Flavobacteriales bacterium]MCB9168218.1 glycosyltransferase family 39 protein [Flavobacteriales bacterium]
MYGTVWRKPSARTLRILVGLTILMTLLTGLRYLKEPPSPDDDQTTNWWPVVNAIVDGRGFVSCLPEYFPFCKDESPTAMREPIPLLVHAGLARATGRSLWAASLFEALLNIAAMWLLFALGRRLAGDRIGLLAAALWATYLPGYQLVLNIAGDQLATVFLLLGALSIDHAQRTGRSGSLILSGLMFGAAALCRSAALAFGVVAVVAVFLDRSRGTLLVRSRQAAVIGAGLALTLLPWIARNYHTFGRVFIGSTLSGYNLYRHNASLTRPDALHFVAAQEGQGYIDSLITAHPELTGHEDEPTMNALYKSAGQQIITTHPWQYLKLCAYRGVLLWTNLGVNTAYGKPEGPLDHLVALLQAVLLVLMLLGCCRELTGRWPIAAAVGLYILMHMAVVARLRFMIPAMPFVMLMASVGLERILRSLGARPRMRKAPTKRGL